MVNLRKGMRARVKLYFHWIHHLYLVVLALEYHLTFQVIEGLAAPWSLPFKAPGSFRLFRSGSEGLDLCQGYRFSIYPYVRFACYTCSAVNTLSNVQSWEKIVMKKPLGAARSNLHWFKEVM